MSITVQESQSSLEQLSFAVRLPASIFQAFDEPSSVNPAMAAILHDTGVVGTILILRKAVMIWFGWGKLSAESSSSSLSNDGNSTSRMRESSCKFGIPSRKSPAS